MTALRVDHCHELMDAACDSLEIGFHAYLTGRVAITDTNPRRDAALKERLAREALVQGKAGHIRHDRVRHRQRSSGGRVNSAPGTRTAPGMSVSVGTPGWPATCSSACWP